MNKYIVYGIEYVIIALFMCYMNKGSIIMNLIISAIVVMMQIMLDKKKHIK